MLQMYRYNLYTFVTLLTLVTSSVLLENVNFPATVPVINRAPMQTETDPVGTSFGNLVGGIFLTSSSSTILTSIRIEMFGDQMLTPSTTLKAYAFKLNGTNNINGLNSTGLDNSDPGTPVGIYTGYPFVVGNKFANFTFENTLNPNFIFLPNTWYAIGYTCTSGCGTYKTFSRYDAYQGTYTYEGWTYHSESNWYYYGSIYNRGFMNYRNSNLNIYGNITAAPTASATTSAVATSTSSSSSVATLSASASSTSSSSASSTSSGSATSTFSTNASPSPTSTISTTSTPSPTNSNITTDNSNVSPTADNPSSSGTVAAIVSIVVIIGIGFGIYYVYQFRINKNKGIVSSDWRVHSKKNISNRAREPSYSHLKSNSNNSVAHPIFMVRTDINGTNNNTNGSSV